MCYTNLLTLQNNLVIQNKPKISYSGHTAKEPGDDRLMNSVEPEPRPRARAIERTPSQTEWILLDPGRSSRHRDIGDRTKRGKPVILNNR